HFPALFLFLSSAQSEICGFRARIRRLVRVQTKIPCIFSLFSGNALWARVPDSNKCFAHDHNPSQFSFHSRSCPPAPETYSRHTCLSRRKGAARSARKLLGVQLWRWMPLSRRNSLSYRRPAGLGAVDRKRRSKMARFETAEVE